MKTTAALALAGLLVTGCQSLRDNLDHAGTQARWEAENDAACRTRYQATPGTPFYDLCVEVMQLKHAARHDDSLHTLDARIPVTKACDPDLGDRCGG